MVKKQKILLTGILLIIGLSVILAGCGGRDITDWIPDLCCGNLAWLVVWLAVLARTR